MKTNEIIPRQLKAVILRLLKNKQSILLLGPRQVGKTTLLKGLTSNLSINLARPSERLEYEKDPSRLEREIFSLSEIKKDPLVIVDEIQKVPALMDQIQTLIDDKKAIFILTGSSARKLKRSGSTNLLPGRVITLKMDPIGALELKPVHIEDRLYFGDLPAILSEKDSGEKELLLQSYVVGPEKPLSPMTC